MEFEIMIFPEMSGETEYPKISLFIKREYSGFTIRGFCEDFIYQAFNYEKVDGINNVLNKIHSHLRERNLY